MKSNRKNVLLVGPKTPPYGGMAIQAGMMQELMLRDGIACEFLPSNIPFPPKLAFCEKLRGARPFLRSTVMCVNLWRLLGEAEVVHILACSWLFFFVVVCPALTLSRLRGKRIVLNYHGGQANDFLAWARFFLKPFFHLADVVTAPSQFLVEVIGRRIGVPVTVVPNIIDFGMFPYRKRSGMKPRLVVSRHLEKLYDIESVIRAFDMVQREYPEASLEIVGTGSEERNLRELTAQLQLRNVTFHGYVPQRQLAQVYDGCDILINASRADNFPGSLLEGAACGLVVVSTGAGGIPHIFENEKNALLVQPGDWKSLGEAALRVLRDPALASALSANALDRCSRYSWEQIRETLYAVYGFEAPQAVQESEPVLAGR